MSALDLSPENPLNPFGASRPTLSPEETRGPWRCLDRDYSFWTRSRFVDGPVSEDRRGPIWLRAIPEVALWLKSMVALRCDRRGIEGTDNALNAFGASQECCRR